MTDRTPPPPPETSSSRFAGVVARLTGVNLLIVALAFVTSPILARALGPSGRGDVAAIFAVVTIAPWVSELGMTAFLSREHARRSQLLGVLLGSSMPITIAGSLIMVALAVPLAHVLGRGRKEVVDFIEIGLFLTPVTVFVGTLGGILVADQRWGVIICTRILYSIGSVATIVTLSLLHAITVMAVAITYIVAGMVSSLPYLVALRGSRPWRFDRRVARHGLVFGIRSWLSTLANTGNNQLDQVLMAGLVDSRQLGLYALAVTLSSGYNSLINATMSALFPRVAAGDSQLAARASRVILTFIIVSGASMAAASPVFVPFLFGRAFDGLIPMLFILLGASVFWVPGQVLGSALIAGGNPSATAHGQIAGLVITVPALLIVLPLAGGVGAACVSFAAYGVTFAIICRASVRTFQLSYRTLLMINRSDLRWMVSQTPGRRRLVSVKRP